jgi:hypothetical protein
MSEIQSIESALRKTARRRRWAHALRGMWFGLFLGAALWLLTFAVYKLAPIPISSLVVAGGVAFLCTIAGFIIGGSKKISIEQTARWVDIRQHLKERISTALEFTQKPDANSTEWRDLVLSDAAGHAKEIVPRKLVPFHLPKVARWTLLILFVAAGLGFVPEYRSKKYLQKKAEQQNIKEVGQRILELTKRNLEQRPPALEETHKSLESVSKLGEEFTKKVLTRSDALKDLASVQEKLKDELKQLSRDPALKKMEQSSRLPGGTKADLEKQIAQMQKQLGEKAGNPEAAEKLKQNLEKLQKAAQAMASQNPGGANDSDKQKMSESLSALSKQAAEAGMQLPQLDEAIAAMQANQTDLFLKDIQAALDDLEKTSDMAKQLQQMQAASEKLGKDLPEQLKNGQAEAAQQTLQKMIEQLKSQNLSQQQLEKMLDEVSKSVDPASPYGKAAEELKKAAQQMKTGEKDGAAQSLANAKQELDKLMQQMGDAQQMADAMKALDRASMCIGQGKGWAQCQGQPGFNPNGSQPGRGVGTWADDNQAWQWNVPFSSAWDNSGIERPDTEGKGQTDRDTALNDALNPTKVKGQFSQGGPMPSITLKGVSIKGQSKIQYEEAATAAQNDAQSALSQEKVPRAYQNAVRDYFDDLKK